ncbi:MAG TPA: ABC transporter substrate-binding protein [Xanthobacteraceae bacterium]|jgi:NitT/TauT family transport system substrate-binding protein
MSSACAARLAGVAAVLLLAAAPAAAQGAKPWRHGIIAPKSDAGFLLMAARGGFAEREGLKLELLEVKDDQIGLKALLAGELESYEGGVQGTIAADVRGADVKILGCHWPVVPHGLMVKAGVGTIQELKGKSIAVSSPGSFPDMFARVALARSSLSPSDVRLAAVGGDRDRYTALVGGVVDAAVVSNEYLPLPTSKNFKMLLSGSDAGPNFLRVCMFSTGRVLAARHEDAVRYLTAQSKALRYALSHREETLKLAREASDIKADDPRPGFVFDDAVKTGAVAPELPIPMDKLAWMQEQLLALGQIPKAGDLATMVDSGIRAEAMQRVGN